MANIRYVPNRKGPTLGVCNAQILESEGCYFKDLARTGALLPFEDWRLPAETRAKDLAERLTIRDIAGLMLYSAHQSVPARGMPGRKPETYDGKPFAESGKEAYELSDSQRRFLDADGVRHVLVTAVSSPEDAARWNNEMQAFCETLGFGIPVNISSDPRHGADCSAEYAMGAGGDISHWPEQMGLAATFDPALARRFGQVAAKEYRALGIATALGPQIDMTTEPRWMRCKGAFSPDPLLATDMARAVTDGYQTSDPDENDAGGWGRDSINAMAKHWPGGGTGESGRDAHYAYGKYAVYPAGLAHLHRLPFEEGALKLEGGTGAASALMPYYTVSKGQDPSGAEVGNSYSRHIITDMLREKLGYDGVVCTDWGVTGNAGPAVETFSGKCWGVEGESVARRHYLALMAGVDQFGGNNDIDPVLEAYRIGVSEHGEAFMRERFEKSAVRLLLNSFRLGLFENPYVDPDETRRIVNCDEFRTEGLHAQTKSVVMLKNDRNTLPIAGGSKAYIPRAHREAFVNFFSMITPARDFDPIRRDLIAGRYTVVDSPDQADFALCAITSPECDGGYSAKDREAGGTGYLPITLQYRPYTAEAAREHSLAGGDPLETFTDRNYHGKTAKAHNESDLDMILNTRKAMGDKPVIAILRMDKPCVVGEFEPACNAILLHCGVEADALLRILTGETEPSGLLPASLPRDMEAVETHCEDAPNDYEPYTDGAGRRYAFGYGLDWNGVIRDKRTARYTPDRN